MFTRCVLQAGKEGVASSPGSDARLGLDVVEGGRTALDNKTSLLNTPSPRSFAGPRSREFAPYGYGETICTYDKSALKEAVFDDDVEQFRDCEHQNVLCAHLHVQPCCGSNHFMCRLSPHCGTYQCSSSAVRHQLLLLSSHPASPLSPTLHGHPSPHLLSRPTAGERRKQDDAPQSLCSR